MPTLLVVAFIALAVGTYALDRLTADWIEPVRGFLKHRLLADPATTNTLLGTIAGGMITVTSITFSLLLLAVQQSAAALTNQVLDQFLHRRLNQIYFGVFVGVSVYALITLATNDLRFPPVFGAVIALVLTLFALMVLILLLYTTLNQMRPDRIIEAIHDLTLSARARQTAILVRTRRTPRLRSAPATRTLRSASNGYIASVDLDRIEHAIDAAEGEPEVVLLVALGDYVCFSDPIAEIGAMTMEDAREIGEATCGALAVERQRNFRTDPGYGVAQLATIGWTSISSAKSNPAPGLTVVRNLRDLLVRWSMESATPAPAEISGRTSAPVVYRDDVMSEIIGVLESLMVAASDSMQHQCAAEVVRTFAVLFSLLPAPLQTRLEDAVCRSLPALGDQVLTADLDGALLELTTALAAAGRTESAAAVENARAALGQSVGILGSRSTRGSRDRRGPSTD